MSRAIVAVIIIACIIIGSAGFYFGWFTPPEETSTMTIKWVVSNEISSTAVPDTADLYLYVVGNDGYLEERDSKLDFSSQAVTTVQPYTTGENLKGVVVDPTDTSYCTLYFDGVVPAPTAVDVQVGYFTIAIKIRNMPDSGADGTMDWDPELECDNGTALTASAVQDVTNSGWNSGLAKFNAYVRNTVDDTGYLASYNFQDLRENKAYFVMSFSGTGWDSVSFRSGFADSFERNNVLYGIVYMSDDDLTRDLNTAGGYVGNRNGIATMALTFDLTGFEAGDNVTVTYSVRYYADWSYFKSNGNWGPDAVAITETVYWQY